MASPERTAEELSRQANRLFMEAFEIESDAERNSFIEQACGSDADLRKEVNRLFSFQEKADTIFQDSSPTQISAVEIVNTISDNPQLFNGLTEALPDDDEVGKQIGNYKLLQKIGEGGVGNVYLAEQSKPVRRQVALKIIKAGMDTKSVITRFEAERQALAIMEHPNIAHVLNAGETDTGRPFFVMELVHGEKITDYSNNHSFTIPQRLNLFIQVCNAIQHAHQKGVIHRDIKPSNVLISEIDGTFSPIVIDFGIAKIIGEDVLTDKTMQTQMESFIGTPSYMSPEQANHAQTDIDMRSDIYSLGVLLYELLVGTPPFDHSQLIKKGVNEMRRVLSAVDPPRPSTMLRKMPPEERLRVAEQCRMEEPRLFAMLTGDLDWIVMKAMEKDRDRRYETANALAVDMEHFLNNEPVIARPPSRIYRLKKMARRNKVVFASGILIVLTISIGFGSSSWLFLRERKAHKRALVAEQAQKQLRVEAEDRERVAQAAYLLSQFKIEEADVLVDKITNLKPSLEAESVLRTLGEWHALNGRWERAAKRLKLLLTVDIKDNSMRITDDLLMAGPILIERGDHEGYEAFRKAALSLYQDTEDPVLAERTMKVCLLLPADEETLEKLRTILPVAEEGARENQTDMMALWRCSSLAMMAYRDNKLEDAIAWCEQTRSFQLFVPARIAIADTVQAMAQFRMGNIEAARRNLAFGQKTVESEVTAGMDRGDSNSGFWYDWLIAQILLREAETLIGPNQETP